MADAPVSVRIEGIPEVQTALVRVPQELDRTAAAEQAAQALLPDIRSGSRVLTGSMAAGYDVVRYDEGVVAFINSEFYWTYQEFGTQDVEPTHAIIQAWESNQEQILKTYDEQVQEAADRAGF